MVSQQPGEVEGAVCLMSSQKPSLLGEAFVDASHLTLLLNSFTAACVARRILWFRQGLDTVPISAYLTSWLALCTLQRDPHRCCRLSVVP